MNLKRILLGTVLASVGLISCDSKQKAATTEYADKMPKIVFADKETYDFGTITEGDTVERKFTFKNKGQFPLIINNINTSCGCTTPEWPREPIQPGASSSIKVRFNSNGKRGVQNKTVTVYANTDPAYTELSFRVLVKPRPDSTRTAAIQ